jgi:hypothetical protein
MGTWEMDVYEKIEVLKQIGVFCDNAYKMADYSKWTLKLRQIDVFTDLVLEGSINILYPNKLKGRYNVWIEYRSKSSKTLVVRVEGTATGYDWVEIDSIKKEPKSEGDNETLKILIPEVTKIMETILNFIKTTGVTDT